MSFAFLVSISEANKRLFDYMNCGRKYRFLIGEPVKKPAQWLEVNRTDGENLFVDDDSYNYRHIQSFVVAYPNGEILDYESVFAPFINGIHSPVIARKPTMHTIRLSNLEDGNKLINVEHSPSTFASRDKPYYLTVVENISDRKIKVEHFGAYTLFGEEYMLNTISNTFFTADEFINWYDQQGEWIPPGQTVSDPQNYGSQCLWVYYCITEDGDTFACGSICPY